MDNVLDVSHDGEELLRSTGKSKRSQAWLRAFGTHLRKLMKDQGYKSVYEFWIDRAGDHISRASLNYIVKGTFDPKLTTIHTLARLLQVRCSKLFEFEQK